MDLEFIKNKDISKYGFEDKVKSETGKLISSLYSVNNIPRSIVHIVTEEIDQYISKNIYPLLKEELIDFTKDKSSSTECDLNYVVNDVFSRFSSTFDSFNTEFERFSFLKQKYTLITPKK